MRATPRGIALFTALSAFASGIAGAADPPRDTLHRGKAEISEGPDPRGMTLLEPYRRRSPSGLLYPYPPEPPRLWDLGGGWQARGGVEVGYFFVGGDENETRFQNYQRREDGLLLDLVNLELLRPERGDYALLRAGSIGREDQFWDLEAGRAGWLRLRGSFSGIPRRYATDAVVLFDGKGSDSLTLPAPLVPGASPPSAVGAVLAGRGEGRIQVQRDQTRISARLRLRPDLALVARYGLDDRHGSIPSSVGLAFPEFSGTTGGTLEVTAPVDDRTHSVGAGLEFGDEYWQANLGYNASLYRNKRDSLTLAQPFDNPGGAPIPYARVALAPDNTWQDLRAEFAAALPLRSRISTTVSWSTSRQDDDLLPPTVNTDTIGTVDLANWSSVAALSSRNADISVDQLLVDVDLYANPWRPLRLHAGYRYADQDTHTDYTAFNPQTDQFGYIIEDGGHAATVGPDYAGIFIPGFPDSRWRYRSIPFGQTRQTYDLGATYAAPFRSSLDLQYRQDDVDRNVSERKRTSERRFLASVASRGLAIATARLSYEYLTRDGGDIDYAAYARYSSESLPGYVPAFPDGSAPYSLDQLVRPALSNVIGQRWKARMNLALGERSDLSISARLRSDDYGPSFGLTSERARGVEGEWSLQISPALSANLFASLEAHARAMSNIRGFAVSSDGSAGGPTFPFLNEWAVKSRGSSVGWGGGLTTRPLPWLELASTYTFLVTREKQDTSYESQAALVSINPASPIPSRLPELRTRDQIVETSLRVELDRNVALRLFHRFERSAVDDFQQTNLPVLIGRRVYFGHEDSEYQANFYGVAVQVAY